MRRRKTSRQRVCLSSGCIDLATQLPSSYKTGRWQKVALSCQKALDMLCQELHDVERRRGWFGF